MNKPDFKYERKLWDKGFKVVAGADEVGRGCFAGPVTAGCVVFPSYMQIPKTVEINDSKKLNNRKRKQASVWIKNNCIAWGVGYACVAEINFLGIKKATERAYRRAFNNAHQHLSISIEYLLIDAFFVPYSRGLPVGKKMISDHCAIGLRQTAIKKGDSLSISIAAASIVAKVERDKLMIKLSEGSNYKVYQWERNKGYGTIQHRNAIIEHGITSHHRKQFVETFLENRGRKKK